MRIPPWLGVLLLACAAPALSQPAVPTLTGRVVDRADILSSTTEETLTALLKSHEDSTSNQVAVLTIASLEGEVIEAYSLRVAETWALGTAANDNGVLLLVAVEDRAMRIEVGYGLEGTLTDAVAGRIIRNEMTPRFRAGDFDGGVLVGVQSIVGVIEGTYLPAEASEEMPPFWFGFIFLIIPTLFAVFGTFAPGCARWFLFLFLSPFFWAGGMVITGSGPGGIVVAILFAVVYLGLQFHPKVRAYHKGQTTKIGPFTMSGGSSGGWSSGGGGWSSGSGFSGGGGSFGGGGASGGW